MTRIYQSDTVTADRVEGPKSSIWKQLVVSCYFRELDVGLKPI